MGTRNKKYTTKLNLKNLNRSLMVSVSRALPQNEYVDVVENPLLGPEAEGQQINLALFEEVPIYIQRPVLCLLKFVAL